MWVKKRTRFFPKLLLDQAKQARKLFFGGGLREHVSRVSEEREEGFGEALLGEMQGGGGLSSERSKRGSVSGEGWGYWGLVTPTHHAHVLG